MSEKIIGIFVCALLIANVSTVLGISEKKVNTDKEGRYYIFDVSSGQRVIKYIEIDDKKGNDLPKTTITNRNDNIAPNPDFEEGDTMPTGWTYFRNDSNAVFHWDSNYSYSGEKSIGVLNNTRTTNPEWYYYRWTTTDFIPVDLVENTYEFLGEAKFTGPQAPDGQWGDFSIWFYDENYSALGGIGHDVYYSSEWQYAHLDTTYGMDQFKLLTKYVKLELGQIFVDFYGGKPDPLVEVRFDKIYFGFGNDPPNKPTITGETQGVINTSYNYTIRAVDNDGDDVRYCIVWDWFNNDTTITDWCHSGEEIIVSHTWSRNGTYGFPVYAIDEYGGEGDRTYFKVRIGPQYNSFITYFGLVIIDAKMMEMIDPPSNNTHWFMSESVEKVTVIGIGTYTEGSFNKHFYRNSFTNVSYLAGSSLRKLEFSGEYQHLTLFVTPLTICGFNTQSD